MPKMFYVEKTYLYQLHSPLPSVVGYSESSQECRELDEARVALPGTLGQSKPGHIFTF